MKEKTIEMDWAGVHDLYEDNRIELSRAFAEKRNKEVELFSKESQKEAVEFLENYLSEKNIKLKCDCIDKFGYMLIFSVNNLRLD